MANTPTYDPLMSMRYCMSFDPRDWSLYKRDAWLYGVVIGWTAEAMAEVAKRHGWSRAEQARLQQLHRKLWSRTGGDPVPRSAPPEAAAVRVEFNVNSFATVVLTARGAEAMNQSHLRHPLGVQWQAGDLVRDQAWELMQVLGPLMTLGSSPPAETTWVLEP
jgi:hypothetical protein